MSQATPQKKPNQLKPNELKAKPQSGIWKSDNGRELFDSEALERAVQCLNSGGTVGMPTETVYGLAARIDSKSGIERIFEQKERPSFDPLIVHIADLEQAKALTSEWPPLATELARAFWPGPMTLVLPKAEQVDSRITSGLETVAIRMPDHFIALELIRRAGPLAAPSANRFGKTSPTSAQHVVDEFQTLVTQKTLLVLEGGPCSVGLESSVLRLPDPNTVEVLRPGAVTEKDLKARFPQLIVKVPSNSDARSPGHLEHHYMPRKPLIRVNAGLLERQSPDWHMELRSILELVIKETRKQKVEDLNFILVKHHSDSRIAARELYQSLRLADRDPESDVILIADPDPSQGSEGTLWSAIQDRIKRAARFHWPT